MAQAAGATVQVLYEDEDVLAVNKPAGVVVHPAYRNLTGTLFDMVAQRQAARGARWPVLLHRLDRDTTGVVLFAQTERARRSLARQFEQRRVRKWYLALVGGRFSEQHCEVDQRLRRDPMDRRRVIVAPDGQTARTRFEVLASDANRTLVLAEPHTGRTHQIRVHLAWLGHPVVDDAVYAGSASHTPEERGMGRQMLHAWGLRVSHPVNAATLVIQAPVPAHMTALMPPDWATRCDARWHAGL